jgi:hypothetical protein
MRGAGLVDAVTDDDMTPRAIQLLYGLAARPDQQAVRKRAEAWKPFRMWAVVLLNVWLRSQPPDVIGPRQLRTRPKGPHPSPPPQVGEGKIGRQPKIRPRAPKARPKRRGR